MPNPKLQLLTYLEGFIPISESLAADLDAALEFQTVQKGKVILEHGQVCDSLYFVLSGFAQGTRIWEGNEITTWFWKEGDVMLSIHSFLQQSPTLESVTAIENMQLLCMSNDALQKLYETHVEFNVVGRKLVEEYFIRSGEITEALRNMTALQKYSSLIETHPDIFQRATLASIASYLGVAKETISRIRSQYAKG